MELYEHFLCVGNYKHGDSNEPLRLCLTALKYWGL